MALWDIFSKRQTERAAKLGFSCLLGLTILLAAGKPSCAATRDAPVVMAQTSAENPGKGLMTEVKKLLTGEKEKDLPKVTPPGDEENQPDYALTIYPDVNWQYPAPNQEGWENYYVRLGFLLRGGKIHLMSDVISLLKGDFTAVNGGESQKRAALFTYALNYVFSDESTTGAAVHLQNGMTNVFVAPDGELRLVRSSMCHYHMKMSGFSADRYGILAVYSPDGKIPEICGDVPVGMKIGIMTAPKQELYQRIYCDDFPGSGHCGADNKIWTVPEFKRR